MANDFYQDSSNPGTSSAGSSAVMRAEFAAIEAGFDKLPTLAGNANKAVVVNSGGSALTVTAAALALAVALTTAGAGGITLNSTGATSVTLPTTGTLATLAGVEELTNKTLNASVGKGSWSASGTWTLPAFTLGGAVSGHFLAGTDNTFDIGASGANRPRDLFLGRNAIVGGALTVTSTVLIGTDVINTNGLLQVNGNIGVLGTRTIRSASDSDSETLRYLGTKLVIGGVNSDAYSYAGAGILAVISGSDSLTLLNVGRRTGAGSAGFLVENTVADEVRILLKNTAGTIVLQANSTGGLLFPVHNSYDIGASGANSPRDLFLGRNAIVGGALTLTATASPTGTGAGAVGQIAWDTAFLYVCTAANDWRRIALVDF
jgi:hypothetical protein